MFFDKMSSCVSSVHAFRNWTTNTRDLSLAIIAVYSVYTMNGTDGSSIRFPTQPCYGRDVCIEVAEFSIYRDNVLVLAARLKKTSTANNSLGQRVKM